MRLHLGTRFDVENNNNRDIPNVTTKSSLTLSKLEQQYRKLDKIAKKNRGGNLGRDKEYFDKLIFCNYRGKDYGPNTIGYKE